jgi:hypothetical protein
MNKHELTAIRLRIILSTSLFIIAAIGIAIFSFAEGQLRQVATDVSHVVVDANASQDNLATLEKIKKTLDNEQDVIKRASSIVAESQSYQYQDQILTDLKDYASKAGIAITNIDFSSTKTTPTTPTTPAPVAQAAPNGVKSTSVTVTLNNPVKYENLLRFIESIEQNLTKMQISKVSISKGTTSNDVTSDALAIEVYIK